MKTTQRNAVVAYAALMGMGRKSMKNRTAYKLFRLRIKLKEIVDFQAEQEQKLCEKMGVTIAEDGRFVFPDDKVKARFEKAHTELEETECEIDENEIRIGVNELPDLSINELEALHAFVKFE